MIFLNNLQLEQLEHLSEDNLTLLINQVISAISVNIYRQVKSLFTLMFKIKHHKKRVAFFNATWSYVSVKLND